MYTEHPFEVMLYALKHGYNELMDLSLRKALELPDGAAFQLLEPGVFIAWVSDYLNNRMHSNSATKTRYYSQWLDLVDNRRKIFQMNTQTHRHTKDEHLWVSTILGRMDRPCSLLHPETLFYHGTAWHGNNYKVVYCSRCRTDLERWIRTTMEDDINHMEILGSFL